MGCGCGGKKSRAKFAREMAERKAKKAKEKQKKEQITE